MRRFFSEAQHANRTILSSRGFGTFFAGSSLEKYYDFPITPQFQESLLRLDDLKEQVKLKQETMNGNLQSAIHDKLRFLWTYHSNAIEGSKLSLGDTIFFLQEGLTVGGKSLKDFLDAKNHARAIDYLSEVVKKAYPVDAHLLRSLNGLLLSGVEYIPGKDAQGNEIQRAVFPGEYKRELNYVIQPDGTIHEYVEPHLVSPQIDGLCEYLSRNPDQRHPIILATLGHYNFVRIHPFQDGNGRGARLLMNLVLMREKYLPAIITIEKRREYLDALKQGDKGNLLPFAQFVINSITTTYTHVSDEIDAYHQKKQYSVSSMRS